MINKKPAIIKSASRVLDIIEYVVKNPKPPTFSAILEYMDIPKSSLSYLLQDLLNREYLQIDTETKVYYPGLKLIQISAVCMNNTNASREIWQGTKSLSDTLGETTHAAILEGRYAVYIAKCQGIKDLSAVSNIGFKIPAHATGVGKVLLSSLSKEELENRLANVELEQYTERTIVNFPEIVEDLAMVAKQGYAVDNQEIIPGGVCIAAPIYDKTHKMIAAISATVPSIRLTDELLQELIRKVQESGATISMRLGKV